MKTKLILTLCIIFWSVVFVKAQTSNHPTIESVKVVFKASQSSNVNTNTLNEMMVVPQATIALKTQTNISKVNFRIRSLSNNLIIYSVSYDLNSSPVFSDNVKLYENDNGNVFISSGQSILLKPYSINVETQDSLQNISTTFSIIQ
jgi:hypothetical protein